MSHRTFSTVPEPFYQLYTIHGVKNQMGSPLLYCWMRNKQSKSYSYLIGWICEQHTNGRLPETCNTNYESGFHKAIRNVNADQEKACVQSSKPHRRKYRKVMLRGCFFHYRRAILQHVQKNSNLLKACKVPKNVQYVRKYVALSLLPPHLVESTWKKLKEETPPGM